MNLIDKYVAEVGKRLPAKTRLDIEAEIRSTLQDMLDDRSRETGQPVDEALISAVLKDYGSPAKVAATYIGPQYLIGPRLYPTFVLVLKIVLAVIVGVGLLVLVISMVSNPSGPEFSSALEKFADLTFSGLFGAFGNIVLIFAILDRTLRDTDFENKEKEWDPAVLAKQPDPDAVKPLDLILSAVFTLIGLSLLNLYSDRLGLWFVVNDAWAFVPFLSEAFFRYLPWINVLGVAQIAFNLIVLRQNRWHTGSRAVSIILKAAELGLDAVMLAGPSLVAISSASVAGTPLAGYEGRLLSGLTLGVSIGLIVSIIVNAIEIARLVYKLLMHQTAPLFPVSK